MNDMQQKIMVAEQAVYSSDERVRDRKARFMLALRSNAKTVALAAAGTVLVTWLLLPRRAAIGRALRRIGGSTLGRLLPIVLPVFGPLIAPFMRPRSASQSARSSSMWKIAAVLLPLLLKPRPKPTP